MNAGPTGMKTDWDSWKPQERANLCFIVRDGRVLLIRKKRGLGAGKINGPGGRLEPGETALAAAVREVQEELRVTPQDPRHRGELFFQFADGYSLQCSVFLAAGCEGEPEETEEAVPLWTPVGEIPFGEMWEDDRWWLPGMLAGGKFRGWFEFDGDTMLDQRLVWIGEEEELP